MKKVKSKISGIVSKIDGNTVEITVTKNKKITYLNLDKITVSPYQVVFKGDVIGEQEL